MSRQPVEKQITGSPEANTRTPFGILNTWVTMDSIVSRYLQQDLQSKLTQLLQPLKTGEHSVTPKKECGNKNGETKSCLAQLVINQPTDTSRLNTLFSVNKDVETLQRGNPNTTIHFDLTIALRSHLEPLIKSIESKIDSVFKFAAFLETSQATILSCPLSSGYMCILPTELVFYIFSFLDLRDLLSCARVSKDWNKIASDDQLFKLYCIRKNLDCDKPPEYSYKWVALSHSKSFKEPIKEGYGSYVWPDKGQYVGEWKDNQRHGYGIQKWMDGSHYKGFWRNDVKHGHGTMTWCDGQSYTGEWWNNRKEGKGIEVWADGRLYQGDYKNSNMHGSGKYTWPSGDCYLGQWEDDCMHGYGTYTWPNGSQYFGQWAHDEHSGWGKYTCENESYEGEWRNNGRHGFGSEVSASGNRYIGYWQRNRRHGAGIFIWTDSTVYKGQWKEGKKQGQGLLVSDGSVYYQDWSDSDTTQATSEENKGLERAVLLGPLSQVLSSNIELSTPVVQEIIEASKSNPQILDKYLNVEDETIQGLVHKKRHQVQTVEGPQENERSSKKRKLIEPHEQNSSLM